MAIDLGHFFEELKKKLFFFFQLKDDLEIHGFAGKV